MSAKSFPYFETGLLIAAALFATPQSVRAQTTNWIAYNDHRPSTTVVNWRITATNVSGYDMGSPGNLTPSPLTNFVTGAALPATISITRVGAPDEFPTVGRPILTNTPMARLFYGICDLSNDGLIGVRATNSVPANATESYVIMTLAGLDPSKRYVLRGSTARNGGYGTRWTVTSISAGGWTDAHINGNGGPGVLTINTFPASGLSQGQAAWNSGANNEGAVVGWNDIAPFPDGTFIITNQQYTGNIPGGTATGGAQYGYSFSAMMLAEVEVVAPTIVSNPPASTTIEQNRPLNLSVVASGVPLNYQWYKQGVGAITGATFATFSVPQVQLNNSGTYYAIVYNSLASRTSAVAQVAVFADTNAPTVETAFSYPTVDAAGVATLDQIVVEFSEPVTPASVNSPANYTVPGGGNPVSVSVTGGTVTLKLSAPLAENTDYSVTVSGATDLAGNAVGSSSASFHSWVSSPGNGLLMESYDVEDASAFPESVLADPDYPNNPFRRDVLRAFDTRLVFPDDTRDAYGARIRGVFIPPVSGDWRFFARTPVLSVLYLNRNGTDEGGKEEILRQSTQNAPYNWDRLQSSLITLRAGRAYYIEGLYKNTTGADYFKVAARLAGTGVPTPVDSPDTNAPDANSLAGAIIAFPLAPRDLGGVLSIVQDIQNQTVEANHFANFAPQVSNPSGLPLSYRWFRNGVAIPGANGPSYSFQVTNSDSGATFSVQVAKIGGFTNSRTATLTVVPDTNGPPAPTVVSSPTNLSIITVQFNEIMDLSLAQEPGNYQLDGNSVATATLAPDGRTVTLELSIPLTANTSYQLTVLDLRDLAGNVINPNPAVTTFTAGVEPGSAPTLRMSRSGGTLNFSWPSGSRLQYTLSLTPPVVWTDATAAGVTNYSVTPSNEFNVLMDTNQEPPSTHWLLDTLQEPPLNLGKAAGDSPRGTGTVTLSNNTLVVDVVYTNLSSARNNDHFHAPGPRGVTAGVAYDLASITIGTTNGTIKGTVPLVNNAYGSKNIAAQIQDIRAGLWYLNIHSVNFGGGEIRGQVEPPGARFYRLVSP